MGLGDRNGECDALINCLCNLQLQSQRSCPGHIALTRVSDLTVSRPLYSLEVSQCFKIGSVTPFGHRSSVQIRLPIVRHMASPYTSNQFHHAIFAEALPLRSNSGFPQ